MRVIRARQMLWSLIYSGTLERLWGCFSRTCNKAVLGNMGLDTFLRSHRDKVKLWWYKLVTMPEGRYPKQLCSQEWNIKPRNGRQRDSSE